MPFHEVVEEAPRATGAQAMVRDEGVVWRGLNQFWDRLVRCHNDVDALVGVIVEGVIDELGDGCVVTRVTAAGSALHAIAVEHRDPTVSAAMRAVLSAADVAIGEGVAGSVAADRRSVVLNDLPAALVEETTPPQYLPFVRDHPMRVLMVVPLIARGELVGTLGAVRTHVADPYTPEDVRLLEALGERAALALGEAFASPRVVGASDFEALYRHNLDGVLISTPDGHILAANPAACELLRASERQIVDAGREGVVAADDPNLERALTERATTGRARAELTMRRFDGSRFVADVASTIFSTVDVSARAVVIFRDISEQVDARKRLLAHFAELEQAADRDPLTGLWNRRGFIASSHQALARADREGVPIQVFSSTWPD
jgi:PAS domain S-box-containing protein